MVSLATTHSFYTCTFLSLFLFFFFNDTATTEIYTLSLHDALPISGLCHWLRGLAAPKRNGRVRPGNQTHRSEEHTSELQSHSDLVCRLLLEKKKSKKKNINKSTKPCALQYYLRYRSWIHFCKLNYL